MNKILERLKNGLIVSCQASPGWPFYGPEHMARMALAAQAGGAVGIRACAAADIRAVKAAVDLPVVGVNKILGKAPPTAGDVIITPTFESASEIIEAGCDILGMDCTPRDRSYSDIGALIGRIKARWPGILIMADISTLDEGIMAEKLGADIISTTLSGYTGASLGLSQSEARALSRYPDGAEPPPDFELITELSASVKAPINAEGRIWEPRELSEAFRRGASMVTVGTAITAPQLITKRFVRAIGK